MGLPRFLRKLAMTGEGGDRANKNGIATCHCERSEAIPMCSAAGWDCRGASRLAMTGEGVTGRWGKTNSNKLR